MSSGFRMFSDVFDEEATTVYSRWSVVSLSCIYQVGLQFIYASLYT